MGAVAVIIQVVGWYCWLGPNLTTFKGEGSRRHHMPVKKKAAKKAAKKKAKK